MGKLDLNCDKCGGDVELDKSGEFGICIYCRSKILIQKEQVVTTNVYGHEGKKVDELIADGNKLLELGDYKKANEKFKQAINIEPKSWHAWFGYATTGGDMTGLLTSVSAYKGAYNAATNETQKLSTFTDMMKHLPDRSIGEALLKSYKAAPIDKQCEMFNLVSGMIGRDASEIAKLAINLCPNDWRAWFAQAKIRQVRVRWCDKKLREDALEVLNIFVRAYQLAVRESSEAKNVVLSHIATMERDDSYKNFIRALHNQINCGGRNEDDDGVAGGLKRFARGIYDRVNE